MSDNKINLKMHQNIFKYGPEAEIKSIPARQLVPFPNTSQISEDKAFSIARDSVFDLRKTFESNFLDMEENIEDITNNFISLNQSVNNNIEIIQNINATLFNLNLSFTANLQNITDVNNIINNLDNLDIFNNNFSSWNYDIDLNMYSFSNVSIGSIDNKNFNFFVKGDAYIDNSLTTFSINFKDIDTDISSNILKINNDNELYYKEIKLTNLDSEEVYNNISSWSLNDNGDTFTFGKVAINSTVNNNFELSIQGNTYISDSIFFKNINRSHRLYVNNNHLYFNDCRLDRCDKDSVTFYLCFNAQFNGWSATDLCLLENEIKTKMLEKDPSIDFSFLEFEFNDIVKVLISIRDDVDFNDDQKLVIHESLKKILLVISDEINNPLNITINGITRTALLNIYFLNEYYHFPELHYNNSFKLVLKDDETNNGPLLSGQQVFLKNLNNEYLQTDFIFVGTCGHCPAKLLLEVHGYDSDFLIFNSSCIISRINGFKLEVYTPVITDTKLSSIIIDFDFIDNINLCQSNLNFTHHGIPDNFLIGNVSLSDLLDQVNNIFLVDERWLNYNENEQNIGTFSSTLNDDHNDSKKFVNGSKFSEVIIADFVFNDTYNLETIEDHASYMFKNKHLPALSSAHNYENYINVYNSEQRREDILEELEKAHIYIYQLNEKVKTNENRIQELEDLINNMN